MSIPERNRSLVDDSIARRIRGCLNRDQINLWVAPYFDSEQHQSNDPMMQELTRRYAAELEISLEKVYESLQHLQCHALEKLRAREEFHKSGLATLRINIAYGAQDSRLQTLKTNLDINGRELRNLISTNFSVDASRLKLIVKGNVIEDESSLQSQGVRHEAQVLALLLTEAETVAVMAQEEEKRKEVDRIKQDAKHLSHKNAMEDDYYFQITDQAGKAIKLPPEEKQALVVAMMLHEQGRTALKKDDFAAALLFFLEADNEYSHCRSQLLDAVDNYALLNLDISWCYLCLQSISDLPDAEKRLQKCENSLKHSYGKDMERVLALKGNVGNEAALFLRLHLLQGIVAFHQNKLQLANQLFALVESEMDQLRVDDSKLSHMIEFGFSEAEGRLGLRAMGNNLELAVSYMLQKRDEKEERKRKEEEDRQKFLKQKRLGKTANGEWVNLELYEGLKNMGYQEKLAAAALRHSNNNMNAALNVLMESPELLDLTDSQEDREDLSHLFSADRIAQLAGMGLDPGLVQQVVGQHRGSLEEVVRNLVEMQMGSGTSQDSIERSFLQALNLLASTPGTRSESSASSRVRSTAEDYAAWRRLRKDMPQHDDDYLNLTLAMEETFLQRYKQLLLETLSPKTQ